jgi:hypothetical protein
MNVIKTDQHHRACITLRDIPEFKILLKAIEDKRDDHLKSAMSTTDPVLQAHFSTRASAYTEFLSDMDRMKP